MRIGLDTTVLVYAHLGANDRGKVRNFVLQLLADKSVTVVLTPLVVHEFVHVVTDPRRFEPPLTMDEATSVARLYLRRENTEIAPVTESAVELALQLMERKWHERRRMADALIAATLIEAGVTRIVTCDSSGFPFEGLDLVDPCSGLGEQPPG